MLTVISVLTGSDFELCEFVPQYKLISPVSYRDQRSNIGKNSSVARLEARAGRIKSLVATVSRAS